MGEQLGESRIRPSSVDNTSLPFFKEAQYKHATQSMESAMLCDCWPSGWLIHHGPKQLVVSTVWKSGALCQCASSFRSNSTSVNETIKNTLQITSLHYPTLLSCIAYWIIKHISLLLSKHAHTNIIWNCFYDRYILSEQKLCLYATEHIASFFFFFFPLHLFHYIDTQNVIWKRGKKTGMRDV